MVHTAGIKGSKWHVCVGGFRMLKVDDVGDLLRSVEERASGCPFQLFDADRVAGWEHIYFAAVNAVKSFEGGSGFSRSLSMEILLYASCQDQITRAFDIMGLSSSTVRAALIVLGEGADAASIAYDRISSLLGAEDDDVLRVGEDKFHALKELYSITDEEVESVGGERMRALADLIVERCALLAIHR